MPARQRVVDWKSHGGWQPFTARKADGRRRVEWHDAQVQCRTLKTAAMPADLHAEVDKRGTAARKLLIIPRRRRCKKR